MYSIVKISRTYKKGTIEGRHKAIIKEYRKQYKTEKAAKMILTKLGFESENKIYDLHDGFKNSVTWEIMKGE
jgi:hypothetical protein